jgi:MFS family permease
MQNIGQAWLVLQLTNSAYKLGIVSALQFVPVLLLSLFAGPFVDRFPKRKVLLFTQTGLMVLALALALLTYFNVVQYWHILVLALMLGLINTLDNPTRQSFIIELVGKEDLMNGIALNSSVFNLARILGPAVAGLLIGLIGIAPCFFINAASFLAVILGLWLINVPGNVTRSERNVLADTAEGLRYIRSKRLILLPLVLLGLISAFVMNFNVLIPVFAKQELGGEAVDYGLLMTAMGAGSFIAALNLAARSKAGPRMKVVLWGALGMSVIELILGFEKQYLLAAVTLLAEGFFSITTTASINTTVQLNSDDAVRGRVMSVYSLVFGGVTPIGSLFAGGVSQALGAGSAFIISGVIGVLAVVVVTVLFRRSAAPLPAAGGTSP